MSKERAGSAPEAAEAASIERPAPRACRVDQHEPKFAEATELQRSD